MPLAVMNAHAGAQVYNVKGKVFPVHAMMTYMGNSGRAPLINISTRCR
jgi:hypothetical protein